MVVIICSSIFIVPIVTIIVTITTTEITKTAVVIISIRILLRPITLILKIALMIRTIAITSLLTRIWSKILLLNGDHLIHWLLILLDIQIVIILTKTGILIRCCGRGLSGIRI